MKLKKITPLPLLFFFSPLTYLQAQEYSYGIKGALIYGFPYSVKEQTSKIPHKESQKISWQAGGFLRMKYAYLFIQPELLYTQISHRYSIQEVMSFHSTSSSLSLSPLIGIYLFKNIGFFVAPVLYLKVNTKIQTNSKTLSDFKSDRVSTAFLMGISTEFSIFILDLKWERNFTLVNSFLLNNKLYKLRSTPSTLSLAIGVKF